MSSADAEYDHDSGDISLSFSRLPSSSSTSASAPREARGGTSALTSTRPIGSSGAGGTPTSGAGHGSRDASQGMLTPTPKLYAKGLFPVPFAPAPPPPSTTTSGEGDEGQEESSAGSSRAGTPSASRPAYTRKWELERPGSATASLPSPGLHYPSSSSGGGARGGYGNGSWPGGSGSPGSPTTPTPDPSSSISTASSTSTSTSTGPSAWNRRSSSNTSLGRSRSLTHRPPTLAGAEEEHPDHHPSSGLPASPSAGANASAGAHANGMAGLRTPTMRIGFSRRPGDPRPPPLVSDGVREKAERWIKEIVVCNFDLERGPVVERRAMGRRWGVGEKENVAFSSFPDTSLFTEGSILFSFKIRNIPPDPWSLQAPEPPSPLPDKTVFGPSTIKADDSTPTRPRQNSTNPRSPFAEIVPPPHSGSAPPASAGASAAGGGGVGGAGDKAEEYRKWDERGREWLFGYVWFEQRKDKGIVRGYMQKSLVILSHLPFPALYFGVLEKIAPIFFEHGYSALEAACHSIASWPDPSPDSLLELPFMSDVITVKIPDARETPQLSDPFGSPSPDRVDRPILASLPNSSPLRSFAPFLPALWSIWECLVLAEPILVIAPDPKRCSEIVWWFRDLLRPIPPAGDFRPYLHIHDHDFSLLVNSNKPQAGVVVGVTNPFFRNAASHWPNVVSVPPDRPRRVVPSGTHSPRLDGPEGFLSRRHRSVQKDRMLLKRLEGLVAEGRLDDPEGNDALRAHFQQLTEKMLVPLNRYFQTLIPPAPAPGTPRAKGASLKPFSIPAFLAHLRTHQPNPLSFRTRGLSTKSRVENDFYASFCMSPTFAGWLAARIESLAAASSTPGYMAYSTPRPRAGLGLGIGASSVGGTATAGGGATEVQHRDSKESHRLSMSTSASTGDTGYASSDATRPSSDSGGSGGGGSWRQSEEVRRGGVGRAAIPDSGGGVGSTADIFGRRGSDGALKALGGMRIGSSGLGSGSGAAIR